MKELNHIDVSDFLKSPIWAFSKDNSGDIDYEHVVPVRAEDVVSSNDFGVMVLVEGVLANGERLKGIVSVNGEPVEILPGYSFKWKNKWLTLALPPSPEFVLEKEGPKAFADSIGIDLNEIFPIKIETHVTFSKTGMNLKSELTIDGAKST